MKKLIAIAMAFGLTFLLGACGGSSGTAASREGKEKLVMLTNATFPPFEYIGNDGGVVGVDVDIAAEVARDLEIGRVEVADMNFDLIIEALKSGKGDFAAAGLTILPERADQVDFSIEYAKSSLHVIRRTGSDVSNDSLDGRVIAVQEMTTGDFYASDSLSAKEVLRFKNATETGAALQAGKCDAVIIDKLPAQKIVEASNGELELIDEAISEERYAFAVRKGDAEMLDAINATLRRLLKTNKINQLITDHMDLV